MISININNPTLKKAVKRQAVVFIDRERCTFITYPSRTINVFSMRAEFVSYGEVTNRTGLVASLIKWIQDNSIVSCECVVVVIAMAIRERKNVFMVVNFGATNFGNTYELVWNKNFGYNK